MTKVSLNDLIDSAKAGKVVSFPTDTVPALAVIPTHAELIFSLKKRPASKPLILMAAKADELWQYVQGTAIERFFWQQVAQQYWPGALTLVLPASDHLPLSVNPSSPSSVGVRVPASFLARQILAQTGVLATTSANLSGEEPLSTMTDVETIFPEVMTLDMEIIPNQASGLPSTVAKWTENDWQILRQGSINLSVTDNIAQIEKQLKNTQLAYQMAVQMNQFKSGFLSRSAHELRSPLSKLISLQQLILFDLCEDTQEQKEYLREAHDLTQKILKTLDHIINISRTEHSRNKLHLEKTELATIFLDIYNQTYLQVANKNLHLEISPLQLDIYVNVDAHWLRQMLVIIIETAITESEQGIIKLSANFSVISDFVEINLDLPCSLAIEPIDFLQKISEMTITKIKYSEKGIQLSSGMNLLLCQTILEAMDGYLQIVETPPLPQQKVTRLQCLIPKAFA